MELAKIEFDPDVKTIDEACALLAGLTHTATATTEFQIKDVSNGRYLANLIIDMLEKAEKRGVEQLSILTHSKLYYTLRKDEAGALDIEQHSSKKGYSGTFVGHRFFAHSRIRPETIIVSSKNGPEVHMCVGSRDRLETLPILILG